MAAAKREKTYEERLEETGRRSVAAMKSRAFQKYADREDVLWETRATPRSLQWEDRKGAFYAGYEAAWANRQEIIESYRKTTRELSAEIHALRRRVPTA